ncbi:MAG: phosphoribosyltransferase family protein [Candidatus Acidiferrales bacterium]
MEAIRALRTGARGWLAEASDAVVSVFFPAGCRICENLLAGASRVPICDECRSSFQARSEKKCEICGQALDSMTSREERPVCRVCQQKLYAFDRARSYGIYEGPLVKAILLLKWERMDPLGRWFAERLAEMAMRESETLAADVVVPVPLHRDRERERGYNQAGLISKPLARRLGLPHKAVLLMRTRPRPNKQVLSFEERWESVRGAFATRPGSQVDNKRVLLVDDVMTTGATLDACARALLESGARSVLGLTVARAARNPLPAPDSGSL